MSIGPSSWHSAEDAVLRVLRFAMELKTSEELGVGDYVFAKMKGYPTWPAQVRPCGTKEANAGTKAEEELTSMDVHAAVRWETCRLSIRPKGK